jgi:hypothetical protein
MAELQLAGAPRCAFAQKLMQRSMAVPIEEIIDGHPYTERSEAARCLIGIVNAPISKRYDRKRVFV